MFYLYFFAVYLLCLLRSICKCLQTWTLPRQIDFLLFHTGWRAENVQKSPKNWQNDKKYSPNTKSTVDTTRILPPPPWDPSGHPTTTVVLIKVKNPGRGFEHFQESVPTQTFSDGLAVSAFQLQIQFSSLLYLPAVKSSARLLTTKREIHFCNSWPFPLPTMA